METDYRNTMATASHIRPVGPHGHDWAVIDYDTRGDVYQACKICGTRRCRSTAPGRQPERQDWLDGAPWGPEAAEDAGSDDTEGRKRGRPPSRKD